ENIFAALIVCLGTLIFKHLNQSFMKPVFLFFLALLSCNTAKTPTEDRLQVNIPTLEEETEYVWRTIIDTKFFEEHNYTVNLPDHPFIEELKARSKVNQLSDQDYEDLKTLMREQVYKPSDYQAGYDKIMAQKGLINQMIQTMDQVEKDWDFKSFAQYPITLTLYGPGGSYDPNQGAVLIFTTVDGKFKLYDNPANTIIHEIWHIGTEASIMQALQVPHPVKERIIDLLVQFHHKKVLPDYQLQGFGDVRMDAYLQNAGNVKALDAVVKKFLAENY
ncbi:MAG: hypothetical protein AAFV80_14945, partial [Bacteroidota bacterium]